MGSLRVLILGGVREWLPSWEGLGVGQKTKELNKCQNNLFILIKDKRNLLKKIDKIHLFNDEIGKAK